VPVLNLALAFMATAALVSAAAARVRVPYTVALVIVGVAAGALGAGRGIELRPDTVVVALVLPLLFEGAIRIPRAHMRTYAPLMLALAIPGTLVAAGVIAAGALVAGLPWHSAIVLGAIASSIDPAGVIALVRQSRLDLRFGTVLEGEAVINDAVAIVLFTLAVAPVPGAGAVAEFVWLLAAGAAVGGLVGAAVAYALGGITEAAPEAIGSLFAAAAAYVAADLIHASGVIAVVTSGLAFAALAGRNLTLGGRETVRVVWDVIAFLANSALFLLVGVLVPLSLLARHLDLIAVVVVAALSARAIAVYVFAGALSRPDAPVPMAWRHVLVWSGLRGGVAVALVLALPPMLPQRGAVAAAVLGLVVWTLIGQALLVEPLMRWTGLRVAAPLRAPAPKPAG
jgi:CPA1 family monovalent cation:H+ antiporter